MLGVRVINNECDSVHFAPYVNAIKFASKYNNPEDESFEQIKEEIAGTLDQRGRGQNVGGLIDIDLFGELMLEKFSVNKDEFLPLVYAAISVR